MRLVLDTNVVMSAFFWNGSPRRILTAGYSNQAILFSSAPMLAELRRVLSRPKFDKRIYEARQSVDRLLGAYTQRTTLVEPVPVPRLVSDPDDDVVVGTAIAAKADLIVTGDHALLAVTADRGTSGSSPRKKLSASSTPSDFSGLTLPQLLPRQLIPLQHRIRNRRGNHPRLHHIHNRLGRNILPAILK